MNGNGLSAGDLALLKDNDGMFGGNGVWAIFLVFLLAWGGNGFGFGNRGGMSYDVPATKDFVSNEFNNQSIINKLNGLENGMCDGFYALNNSGKDNAYATQNGITNLGYEMQNCCCTTNRNIDAMRYENAKNTCDIINAGNTNTQRIVDTINAYVMEQKDTKIAEQGQLLSEQRIINTINSTLQPPRPIPAYQVANPYCGYNACACGTSLY